MIRMKKTLRRAALLSVVAVAAGFVGFTFAPSDEYFEISKNLDIFGKMYREIHANYVDPVEPGKFMRTGMDAMLGSLDPYTNYISAAEIEEYRFTNTGQYGGIGAAVSRRDGKVIITEPYEGYPAATQGLRAGDEILKIDDLDLSRPEVAKTDVRELLHGAPNTPLRLLIRREGTADFTVNLNRADVKIKNVPYFGMIDNETGYISLTGFMQGAGQEVRMAYEDLRRNNPGMKSLVLDLRGNPGGLLLEAVEISNLFVAQREKIVETRGRTEGAYQAFYAEKPPLDLDMPLAVIVNRKSASASEIVSGVMQDLDRGVIVGQRSFGKGLVQNTKPLSFNTQIKLTTAKYYTPSGRCIQALDYSHRNDDGSVGKVPDSLVKAFPTKNGRTVYDGGGVMPDVEVKLPEYHAVVRELVAQGILFDFATKYRNSHETIPALSQFQVDDALYGEFVAYVNGRGFKYATKTETELETLKKLMKEESYFDDMEKDIAAMEARIASEKAQDLTTFKKEISNLLRTEIIMRYHYKKGEYEASFSTDPDVLEAVKVLKDQARYKKILGKV
jgi:carboxyl-terminal processing protease